MAIATLSHNTNEIRNLALAGHAASGKTSLAEALLAHWGSIGQAGQVESGNTTSDYHEQEIKHSHSLHASLLTAHTQYRAPADPPDAKPRQARINLIDTPGTQDFCGQAYMVLPAVETACIVINAAQGVEPMTQRMMDKAQHRNLPRMIVVNKIDQLKHTNQSYAQAVQQIIEDIQTQFGHICLPVNLPANQGQNVLDCFFHEDGQSDIGPIQEAHTALIEQCIEVDETLLQQYLGGDTVDPNALHDAFEKAMRESHLIPICFTSACPNDRGQPTGIAELASTIENLLPSPCEGNPRPFIKINSHQSNITNQDQANQQPAVIQAQPDPNAHVLAHCFHVSVDPFVGKLCAIRVHQGTLTPGTQLFVGDPQKDSTNSGDSKKSFRVGHIYQLQGKNHQEVNRAVPGDLVAIAKVDSIHFDCVLHDHHDEDAIRLKPLRFPEPLFGLAISPEKHGDEQKLADAMNKLLEEDPTLSLSHDHSTHQTVLHGLGELHLKMILERLESQYHVNVKTQSPKIAYRETITGKAQGHYRHKKQTGGAGQFGEVYLKVQPLPRGEGFVFIDDTFGGSIPKNFMPAIEKGVRMAMDEGILTQHPMQDVQVSVYDGKHHPVDSKEIAFIEAGKRAFAQACKEAKPVVLEPMADVHVTAPMQAMGAITADLTSKRGRILDTQMRGETATIQARMPMSEVSQYAQALKGLTAGQGRFTLEPSGYEPAPRDIQIKIMQHV